MNSIAFQERDPKFGTLSQSESGIDLDQSKTTIEKLRKKMEN